MAFVDLRDQIERPVANAVKALSLIFHPAFVVVISILCALMYAALVTWRFRGGNLTHHYYYVVPVVIPAVAFLFDRARYVGQTAVLAAAIDALVVFISLLRMFALVPLISGHALFLGYAVLRRGSLFTRISAALLLAETVYLKFFVWHDPVSPMLGIALATAAAMVTRRTEQNNN